jgi:hypothetical protein
LIIFISLIRMAEEKVESAESQRRAAERRAAIAESECSGLRDRLDKQGRELETLLKELEAERGVSEGLRRAAQEAAQQVGIVLASCGTMVMQTMQSRSRSAS